MSKAADRERSRLQLPNLWRVAEDEGCCWPSGYVVDCVILCVECAEECTIDGRPLNLDDPEEVGAYFSSEETDSPSMCDACGILIPTNLTSYGQEYVRASDGRTRAGKLYREAFPWAFRKGGAW